SCSGTRCAPARRPPGLLWDKWRRGRRPAAPRRGRALSAWKELTRRARPRANPLGAATARPASEGLPELGREARGVGAGGGGLHGEAEIEAQDAAVELRDEDAQADAGVLVPGALLEDIGRVAAIVEEHAADVEGPEVERQAAQLRVHRVQVAPAEPP